MLPRLELWADLHCPYAYLAAWRLRRLRPEWRGRVDLVHRALPVEMHERRPTPKRILDAETPLVLAEEPGVPWRPWSAPESQWPVTFWPAFEAVKCAERQGLALADELDLRIRRAFFAESRCVSMRHVLLDLAREAGLDVRRFEDDFDSGIAKAEVIADARAGWEVLALEASPTLLLPSGRRVLNPAAPRVDVDEETGQVRRVEPPPAQGEDALEVYRRILDEAGARREPVQG